MNESYLSIGTNIGDKQTNLNLCIEKISNLKIQILKVSSIYLTDPLENISQPEFYNIVIQIRTIDTLDKLFYNTKNIEIDMGRPAIKIKNSPRIIDIDLLTFSNMIVNTRSLTLPHPKLHRRKFVLKPWYELDPDFIVPGYKKSVSDLLNDVKDVSKVRKLQAIEL